jgi:hypothetical protein
MQLPKSKSRKGGNPGWSPVHIKDQTHAKLKQATQSGPLAGFKMQTAADRVVNLGLDLLEKVPTASFE